MRAAKRRNRERGRVGHRAQTTIDFAIGIGVFLLVVAFVVAFVPTIFTPFQSAEGPGTADRIATSLSTDRLGDPATPYVLNDTCTNAFFDQLNGGADAPTSCGFDTTADTTDEMFTPGATRDVNVSIRTLDGTVVTDGVQYTAGPPVTETTSVTAATRVVYVNGEPHRLLVRTW
ncbi:DUF7287 family protein [Halobellus ordinarius]|uniref:DUF7287 family protein n=1 Tax=Halobellus ordinarius TaxID=3075120 RepID=UPI00288018E4|nr:hypothetical protein [Halobellus sp. ZY16]